MAAVSETKQYVLFHVGPEEYGLPIDSVSSIIRYEASTPVPRAPETVEGVINLRGRVVPVVDLGRRLFGRPFEETSTSRIVIAEGEAGPVGLAVDSANEVANVDPASIMPAPTTALSSESADAFEGVVEHDDRLVILLDLERALPRGEYDSAASETDLAEGGEDV